MKVVGICILLLFANSVEAAQQRTYYGSIAAAVRLPGPVDKADSDRITIRPGDVITTDNVRQSIESLYATKHYQTIEVKATTEDAGVALTFLAQPFAFFSGIQLDPPLLLDRSLMSFIRIPLGTKFSTPAVDRVIEATHELLKSQGYFNAAIHPVYKFDKRLASVTLVAQVQPQARVSSVHLEGGELTFPNKELLEALGVKAGDNYTLDKLEEGTGRIRQKFTKLGFLNTHVDVQSPYDAATNSVEVRIHVDPGLFAYVNARAPDGDPITEVTREDLRALVPIFLEGTVDDDLIKEGKRRLTNFLHQRGYFDASAEWERLDAPQNDAVQITYIVTKGELRRLGTIQIQGARYFTEEQLKEGLRVRSSVGQDPGVFSRDQLNDDILNIKTMYSNAGYFAVSVKASEQEDSAEQSLNVIIEIEEGPRYLVGQVLFSGNSAIAEAELRKGLLVSEDNPYTAAAVSASTNNLLGLYHSQGYADARIVIERENVDPEKVYLTFKVTEGNPYRIGDVLVSGNTITAEKIIRRNSKLQFNEPFSEEAILLEQHRLYATGRFTRVQIVPLDEEHGQKRNLMIYIEDAKPIQMSYGLGYKESEGLRGTFELSHSNLWGLNRTLSSRIRLGQKERSFQASYSEPYLFNHNIGGFASFFIEKAERRYYTASTVDFSLQTVSGLRPHSNLILTASYQTVNLQDVLLNPAAERDPNLVGVIQIARIGASLVQDRRDDAVDPHRGSFRTTTFQVASKLIGSEVNFSSLYNQSIFYRPLARRVLAYSSRIGWKHPFGGDTGVPISERYFAGGSTTLRGFSLDELRAGGGQLMVIENVEYRASFWQIPPRGFVGAVFKDIGGALFYDTGNVFVEPNNFTFRDFTHTVGAGVRANTRMGPIRLDLGVNLLPKFLEPLDGGDPVREKRIRVFLTLGNAF